MDGAFGEISIAGLPEVRAILDVVRGHPMTQVHDGRLRVDRKDDPLHAGHEPIAVAEIRQEGDDRRRVRHGPPEWIDSYLIPAIGGAVTARTHETVRSLKLLKFDLHDFVLDRLDRRLDFDEIADTLSDQCSTDGRLDGDAVELHIGFILPNERILAFGLGLLLDDHHRGAEHDRVRHPSGNLDDPGVSQLRFDFRNARLDESLTLLRGIIFRVFTQVPVRPCLRNGFDHLWPLDLAQTIQLGFERIIAFLRDRCWHSSFSSSSACSGTLGVSESSIPFLKWLRCPSQRPARRASSYNMPIPCSTLPAGSTMNRHETRQSPRY